jgi:hypothetical protein
MRSKNSSLGQCQLKRNKFRHKKTLQKRTKASSKKTYPSSWQALTNKQANQFKINLYTNQTNILMNLNSRGNLNLLNNSTGKEASIHSTFKGWTQKQIRGTVCNLTTRVNLMINLRYSNFNKCNSKINSLTHSVGTCYLKEVKFKGISLSSHLCIRARRKWRTDLRLSK